MSNNKKELYDYLVKNGKTHTWGELASTFNVTHDVAKHLWRNINKSNKIVAKTELNNYVGELEETIVQLIDKVSNSNSETLTFTSNKPLSPKEIQDLAQVDNINTFVSRTWLKSHRDGKWTYSIDVKCKVDNFYTKDELSKRIKELLPTTISTFTQSKIESSGCALFVYISDDHCGLELKSSNYDKIHNEYTYEFKLNKLFNKIQSFSSTFEKVYIVNLGDTLDGLNGTTTRGGHPLDCLDNKSQFDTYVNARIKFFNSLLRSNVSDTYEIINIQNSNHSGNGFAYMADRAIELYLEQAFDNVTMTHTEELIHIVRYGNHIIGLTHGKDQKYMKSPMPLNLDPKTDAFLFEYFDSKGYSASTNWLRLVKGDIHKLNFNQGKFGAYVNVPSISSGSNWIEHNFGNSKSGVLLEIVNKGEDEILSIPVWFK